MIYILCHKASLRYLQPTEYLILQKRLNVVCGVIAKAWFIADHVGNFLYVGLCKDCGKKQTGFFNTRAKLLLHIFYVC